MPSPDKRRMAFRQQKRHARLRGIAFHFTYDEWVEWWGEQLGPRWFEKRGATKGKYVMARLRDRGPYRPGNVKCVTCTVNHLEGTIVKGEKHGMAKLTDSEARAIKRHTWLTQLELAEYFSISRRTVRMIRSGKRWKHV